MNSTLTSFVLFFWFTACFLVNVASPVELEQCGWEGCNQIVPKDAHFSLHFSDFLVEEERKKSALLASRNNKKSAGPVRRGRQSSQPVNDTPNHHQPQIPSHGGHSQPLRSPQSAVAKPIPRPNTPEHEALSGHLGQHIIYLKQSGGKKALGPPPHGQGQPHHAPVSSSQYSTPHPNQGYADTCVPDPDGFRCILPTLKGLVCNSEPFSTKENCYKHQLTAKKHNEVGAFPCGKCHYPFTQKRSLDEHNERNTCGMSPS